MAGVTDKDNGTPIKIQVVPAIGGKEGRAGLSPDAQVVHIVDGGHVENGDQAVSSYPAEFGAGPTGDGYPEGSVMTDSTPNDQVN